MNPVKRLFGLLLLALVTFSAAQTVAITGKITDNNGRNVSGAIVKLKALKLTDTTDTAGNYSFGAAAARGIQPSPAGPVPFFSGNFLTFTVARDNELVRVETFDCRGRCVAAFSEKALAAGTYRTMPFPAGFSSQMYFCRVTVGNTVSRLMKNPLFGGSGRTGSVMQKSRLAKVEAAVDTLLINRAGYVYTKYAIDSYTGTFDVVVTVSVTVAPDVDTYQGIDEPMYITAKDPYATAATVDAIVTSKLYPAPDTVELDKVAGIPGMYEQMVYFIACSAKSGKDTILTHDNDSITITYRAASPLTTVATAKAIWLAMMPSVKPSTSIYLGLKNPITVIADDRNITDPSITVHIASHKDTVGFNLVLPAVAGSPGSYQGFVGASLTQSVAGSVLAVRPPIDTLTTIYQSCALNTPVVSDALQGTALLWKATSVSIMPDSLGVGYHGTTNVMNLTVENDHIIANSFNINVKSKKDPTGFAFPVTARVDTTYLFTGTVGFTTGASSATNKTISVAGNDTITVWYFDQIMAPPETSSVSVTWRP
ncbi:MAG TPA: hypothetical protein VLX68_17225 [Chitinivibrionales bacterium]|nr:hypothetical protein [Chitinivibrionales bacterium]